MKLSDWRYNPASLPSWDEIVAHMQHVEFDAGCGGSIVTVLWSRDRTKRIGIIQSCNGYFRAIYEEIRAFEEDEWNTYAQAFNRYPAWWEPVSSSINTKSFYGTMTDTLKEVQHSYEYITFFA